MMITIYIRYFELYYENYLPSLNHSDSSLFYGRKVAVLFNGFFYCRNNARWTTK